MAFVKQILVISFLVLNFSNAMARDWRTIVIPGAFCGDGSPYKIYVQNKKSKNLYIEFMGGGACWSKKTCNSGDVGSVKTWIHSVPKLPFYSYLSSDIPLVSSHPFTEDSAVYLPYCTGDVFAANHTAQYSDVENGADFGSGDLIVDSSGPLTVKHVGYKNILLTLQHIQQKRILPLDNFERVTVVGSSAGAMGALIHLKNIEPYFIKTANKIAIIDSPGLHFGPTFWDKFTPELFEDYKNTFADVGVNIEKGDGFIAKQMGTVIERYHNWKMAFFTSTEDEVMSESFGDISKADHKKLVLSDQGLPAIASHYQNVFMWLNESDHHTFFIKFDTPNLKDIHGVTAINFVEKLVQQ